MSIINEALKKAEKYSLEITKDDKPVFRPLDKTYPDIISENKKKISSVFIISVIFFTVLSIGFITLLILNRNTGAPSSLSDIPDEITEETAVAAVSQDVKGDAKERLTEQPIPVQFVEKTIIREDIPEETHPVSYVSYKNRKDNLTLSGIMYSRDRPLAVINDLIMHEGEESNGVKVIKIDSASVDVESGGETLTLRLKTY